jgi:hypothetical protein
VNTESDTTQYEDAALKQFALNVALAKASGEYALFCEHILHIDLSAQSNLILIGMIRNMHTIRENLVCWDTMLLNIDSILLDREVQVQHILRGI